MITEATKARFAREVAKYPADQTQSAVMAVVNTTAAISEPRSPTHRVMQLFSRFACMGVVCQYEIANFALIV